MKQYMIFVADDNGWCEGCPDYEGVFFGDVVNRFSLEYVHPAHGGHSIAGHIIVTGYRNGVTALNALRIEGDWVAPREINPEGEATPPVYAMQAMQEKRR